MNKFFILIIAFLISACDPSNTNEAVQSTDQFFSVLATGDVQQAYDDIFNSLLNPWPQKFTMK